MSQHPLRILVVDDDPLILDLMAAIAQDVPESVVSATGDPLEAERLLTNGPFDLVITDLVMPERSGLDLLQLALRQNPHCAVTLVTGFGDMEDALRAIKAGAYGYLHKPFRREELALVLSNMAARHALRRQNSRLLAERERQEGFITHLAAELQRLQSETLHLRKRLVQLGLEMASPSQPAPDANEAVSQPAAGELAIARELAELATLHSQEKISAQEFRSVRSKLLARLYGEPYSAPQGNPEPGRSS